MDKKNIVAAWGRAQSFIGKYSSEKLQTATDYILETTLPGQHETSFGSVSFCGYSITKTPVQDNFEISVKSNTGKAIARKADADMNAKILAYYIATGEIRTEMIAK